MTPPIESFLGIPHRDADCVALTLRYLEACGITAPDPRLHSEAWEPCSQDQAVIATYRDRSHVAALVNGCLLESRPGHVSYLLPIRRAAKHGLEFWRLRA